MRHILLAAMLSGLLCPLDAGINSPPMYTIKHVITQCLRTNLDLYDSRLDTSAARQTVRQASAAFMPSVNASAGSGISGYPFLSEGSSSGTNISAGLHSDITVFDGFKNSRTLEKSKCSWLASCNTLEARTQEITYAALTYYLKALLDSEVVILEKENLDVCRAQQKKIEAFHDAGERPLADVLSERYLSAQAELGYIEAQHEYLADKLLISKIMGDSLPDPDFILNSMVPESLICHWQLSDDTLLNIAFTRRKDILAGQHTVKASELSVDIAKSSFYPSVGLSANTGSGLNPDNRNDASVTNRLKDNTYLSASLSLSIPIFNRLSTVTSVNKAYIATRSARNELERLKRTIAFEIKQATLDYERSMKKLQVTNVELVSAREAYDATSTRYDVGAATHTDLIVARTNFDTAALDRVKAQYGVLEAILSLAYTSGNIDRMYAFLTKDIL